jgi:KUP system potassium uptake protein
MAIQEPKATFISCMKAAGLVFGDVGTSPIYTFGAILLAVSPTAENALGVLSLIIWTLILIVSVQYAWLAIGVAEGGEGGPMVLRERLGHLLKKGRHAAWCTLLLHLGIGLMLGDGVITPAMSILSAVEGIVLVPGLEATPRWVLLAIALALTWGLFRFQKYGADRVSMLFGPIMLVWFASLFFSGAAFVGQWSAVWQAFNPWLGLSFIVDNGIAGFFILSQVILCATGGEALFSDIGHLGRRPIQVAWIFIFIALVINYLGQGAFLQTSAARENILFAMFQAWWPSAYVPFLILTCVATVIASQSVISSVFSVIYQVVNARVFPPLKVDYTSVLLKTQVYLPVVNWILFAVVALMLIVFQESAKLASAYGLAVIGTMSITGLFLLSIFGASHQPIKAAIAALLVFLDLSFLLACFSKIPDGGYWSILIAAVPFVIMRLYHYGQIKLSGQNRTMPMAQFSPLFLHAYQGSARLPGRACWAVRSLDQVPPYLLLAVLQNRILYQDNVLCHVEQSSLPYGITAEEQPGPCNGLTIFKVIVGYKEVLDLSEVFRVHGYQFNAVFYGAEDIQSHSLKWRLFGLIKRMTSSWALFYRLPKESSHGVIVQMSL